MKLLVALGLLCIVAVPYSSAVSAGQGAVQIDAPSPYIPTGSFPEMHPTVKNGSSQPITYCVDLDQTSFQGSLTQSTPTPFSIEAKIRGKWQLVPQPTGVERLLSPVVLAPGETKEYPFELRWGVGPVRLVLTYWIGSHPDLICESPDSKGVEARSQTIDQSLEIEY